jgi:carnitine O-acetyltransferase
MDAYNSVFKSCRLPHRGSDEFFVSPAYPADERIIALSGGNIYELPVKRGGKIIPAIRLEGLIADILSRRDAPGPNIGAITACQRDRASDAFDRIISIDPQNKNNLETIKSSLFAICIDEPKERRNENEAFKDILFGHGRDRYFDKSVQLIAGTDGYIGFNNEHSGFDGAIWLSVMAAMHRSLTQDEAREEKDADICHQDEPRMLTWNIDDAAREIVGEMERGDRKRAESLRVEIFELRDFGGDKIKKLGMSPDAFFHLSLQMAYYRAFGHLCSTYEAVSVRNFYQGRTECARPSTVEALALSRAAAEGRGRSELRTLALEAASAHGKMLSLCKKGLGPERHLLGLRLMLNCHGEEIALDEDEDIFIDESYKILTHDTLSTSNLSSDCVKAFGFGPVVDDGFGVGYGVTRDKIRLCMSCWKGRKQDMPLLLEKLKGAFIELRSILEENAT